MELLATFLIVQVPLLLEFEPEVSRDCKRMTACYEFLNLKRILVLLEFLVSEDVLPECVVAECVVPECVVPEFSKQELALLLLELRVLVVEHYSL